MKLYEYQISIECAYTTLLSDISLQSAHSEALAINFIRRRPAHVIPRERSHALPPLPVQEYEPSTTLLPLQAKEKMLQLATFQSTYHGTSPH
jgi:hypothetical protein